MLIAENVKNFELGHILFKIGLSCCVLKIFCNLRILAKFDELYS